MQKFIKNVMLIMLGFFILLPFNSFVFAGNIDDQKKVDSIKVSVERLFEQEKPILEVDKKNWGLSDEESFSNAVLGDGVAYYTISEDWLNSNQKDADPFILSGYIFPIKVGNKAAGIIKVQEIDGKLTIVGGLSDLSFEKDLTNVKMLNNNNSDSKFVYDESFHVSGLAILSDSGYDFVPTSNNKGLGLTKNEIKPFKEVIPEIENSYKDAKNHILGGLGDNNSNTPTDKASSTHVVLGIIIILIGTGTFFVLKRKQIIN